MSGSTTRRLRRHVKGISSQVFFALDRVGLHVLPKHYYASIPDYTFLRRRPEVWRRRISLAHLEWDLDAQLSWLTRVCSPYYHEVTGLDLYHTLTATQYGPGYGAIESQVLWCFMRSQRPNRVVEVGSGVTTAIMARASALNEEEGFGRSFIVAVDPFASERVRRLDRAEVLAEYCQVISDSVFDSLSAHDLLFIDSTHVVKTGSEVLRVYLEVIPRLRPGVIVCIHDIYLPYLFRRDFLSDYFDWQESSLVLALLTHNSRLKVLCCESALHYDRREELKKTLPDYNPGADVDGLEVKGDCGHFPASLWLVVA